MSSQPKSPTSATPNAASKINSLNNQLANLARHIEDESSDKVFASILLLDESGKKLFRGAAPSLPEEYSNKIDGIEIGPKVGSCGTAAFFGHAVFVVLKNLV